MNCYLDPRATAVSEEAASFYLTLTKKRSHQDLIEAISIEKRYFTSDLSILS
jgi:hypothetical protein